MDTAQQHYHAQQRRIEERRAAPKQPEPVVNRADRIIAAGHAARTEHRCKFPDADTAMVFGAQIGYLHGEVRRLCAELEVLDIERDKDLEYIDVTHPYLACDVTVGVTYEPGSPARITSAAYFERTGDPGDPGDSEYLDVVEVWVNGVEIAEILSEQARERLADSALEKLHAIQAKAREGDF